jgi:capsular exopolysaccharide synthesis family protein
MSTGEEKSLEVVRKGYPEQVLPFKPPYVGSYETPSNPLVGLLNLILARRATFITVALAVMAIGIISLYKQVPVYRATANVEVDPETNTILPQSGVVAPVLPLFLDDLFATQYKILESPTLARAVISDLHLDKEFDRNAEPPGIVDTSLNDIHQFVANRLRPLLPSRRMAGGSAADVDPLRPYVNAYLANLMITPVTKTRLVAVSFENPDPSLAARIANAHAEHFIEQNLQRRWDATQVAADFLRKELASMRSNLEKAEDNLQAYSANHQLFVVEDVKGAEPKNTETERLSDLEGAYTKAQTERIEKESAARLAREAMGNQAEAGPAQAGSPSSLLLDLQRQDAALAARFQPDFGPRKEIQNQIQAVSRAIEADKIGHVKRAEEEYAAALDREKAFEQELENQGQKVNRMKQENVQYEILKREADSNRQLYDALLLRLKEAGMESSLKASNIRIVDRAQAPDAPIRPDKRHSEFYTFILAIIIAIGAVYFQEYMDNSLKSPDDVTKYLKLPTLGLIPRFQKTDFRENSSGYLASYMPKRKANSEADATKSPAIVELVSHSAPASLSAEAYRSLRASLILASPDHPPRTILITSSVPSEGKTATAINLAISLTQTGARVLLIDADMRRPRIDTLFSLRNKVGLSNYLTGTEEIESVLHETQFDALSVIPCGVVPPNPGELILSARFKKMLEILQRRFDYVVIDSPPLSNVSDGRIIAAGVDGVVFVVRALSTSRHAVVRSLELLDKAHSRLLGVVLNDYDVQKKGNYYYPYYKQSYYKSSEQKPV